ncbi:uncharacterized protein LOC133180252 [Saccostrea echinata]|uniref:uncharacterized protein LOC133180252 n=1 Tax=Saccostrea echinata TaxID=191078 RepID=UPI002A7EF7E9|nr:uncharacterized protein LOC133180252 [Saccostrea echinata]
MIAGLVFGIALFIQTGIFGTIVNSDKLSDGTCDSEDLRVEIGIECEVENIKINIVSNSSHNDLMECRFVQDNLHCHHTDISTSHNYSNEILIIATAFNHTIHAGYPLWVNTTCRNNSTVKENILLKPCRSGFQTSAYVNNSNITISCEHKSFRMSAMGIRIVDKEDLAHCWWSKENQTTRCYIQEGLFEVLDNGVKYTTPYTQGMNITCLFDEQSVEILPQQQTTHSTKMPITTATRLTTTTTTEASDASPSGQSGESGQTKPACTVAVISILCILCFIYRDIFI